MNLKSQKSALIQWISNLDNMQIINELEAIKNSVPAKKNSSRHFGCGSDIIIKVAEDFNAPLEHFKEYQP
jgi:hypothetical protein